MAMATTLTRWGRMGMQCVGTGARRQLANALLLGMIRDTRQRTAALHGDLVYGKAAYSSTDHRVISLDKGSNFKRMTVWHNEFAEAKRKPLRAECQVKGDK